MTLTQIAAGQRVGFWAAAWDHNQSETIPVPGPSGSLSPGDRLFLWVDWFYERPTGILSVTRTGPGAGWELAHTPVLSSAVGGGGSYFQTGELWTKEWNGPGDEDAEFAITVLGSSGSTAGIRTYTGLGAHMFGYTGGRLEQISDGRLQTVTFDETSPSATAGAVPAQSLILTYASNLVYRSMNSAPFLNGAAGYALDSSLYNRTALPPGVPRVEARFRVTTSLPGLLGPALVDGIAPSAGDRLLLTDQSPTYQRGIYQYNGSGVPMTRTADADSVTDVRRLIVDVAEGISANRGRWEQYEYVNSITTGTDGGVNTRINFRKDIYHIPSNSRASRLFPAGHANAPLPRWHVAQGNQAGEAHAGWSAWAVKRGAVALIAPRGRKVAFAGPPLSGLVK